MNELIVWALFFIFYLIFQALGNKKKPRTPAPLPEGEENVRSDRPATLEDALREIQEALRQPQQQPKPQQQAPPPEPVKARTPEPRKTPRPVPAPVPEFRSLERKTLREDAFEKKSLPQPKARRRPEPLKPKPAGVPVSELTDIRTVPPAAADEKTPFQKELHATFRSPEELKKAFLIREILGPAPYQQFMARWSRRPEG